MKRILALHLILALLLSACAHDIALMKKEETLHAYAAAIRWSDFAKAASFQSKGARRPKTMDAFSGIKVTGYHPVVQDEDMERRTLTQRVEIRYYRIDDLREHTVIDEQSWRFDENLERWLLESPLPRFD